MTFAYFRRMPDGLPGYYRYDTFFAVRVNTIGLTQNGFAKRTSLRRDPINVWRKFSSSLFTSTTTDPILIVVVHLTTFTVSQQQRSEAITYSI